MEEKSSLRLALEAIPFFEFLESSWAFVKNPEIKGEALSDSLLIYAGQNFVKSLFLVTLVMAAVGYGFPHMFDVDIGKLINPLYLSGLLVVHALILAIVLATFTSFALLPKGPKLHYLVGHQVVQAYAVLNLFVIAMFWIAVNHVLKAGDPWKPTGDADMVLSGTLAVTAMYLAWRLIVSPIWRYTRRYYSKGIAISVTAAIFSASSWATHFTAFGFSDLVINKPIMCKLAYEQNKRKGLSGSGDEACFLDTCLAQSLDEKY